MNISEPHVKIPLIIGATTVAVCWMIVSDIQTTAAPIAAPPTSSVASPIEPLRERIAGLETKVLRLEGQLGRYTSRWKTAEFDPTEDSFQRIDSDIASFAVSLANLQPYGDGSRITIKVGNPSAASFQNVKLNVKYGPRWPDISDPKFAEKYAEVEAQVRTKEITLTKKVAAGSWNPNPIVLPGLKPDVLGFVEIGIDPSAIFLTQN